MWKISKVKFHNTHGCDQISFATDLYSILRATADRISLKLLTQFWITGSHERVGCFPSVSLPQQKILRMGWNNIAEIPLLLAWMCEVTYYVFSFSFFKLWYLSWSLTTECCKGLFLRPRRSMCAIFLQINASESEVTHKAHNIKKFGRYKL